MTHKPGRVGQTGGDKIVRRNRTDRANPDTPVAKRGWPGGNVPFPI